MGMPIERDITRAIAAQAASQALPDRFAVLDLRHAIVGEMTYATVKEAEDMRFKLRVAMPNAGPLGVGRVRERIVREVEPLSRAA